MDTLIKQRACCKASITRISTWYEKNKNDTDKYAYKFRLESLESHFNKYCSIQDNIESSAVDIEAEHIDRESVENKYYNLRCKLQNAFDGLNSVPLPVAQPRDQELQSGTQIRLPFIDIPIFTGESTKYGAFMDLFTALIINNSRLTSKTEKFYYLKSYLRSEPLSLISQLPVNENNFDVAIELLKARYDNKRQVVTAHFNKITSCNNISKCTAQQLRNFTSESKSIINSLLNLNITKEELFDALIVHLLKNKLDFNTRKALEEKETDQNLITSDKFFDFLEKKCNVLENLLVQEQKLDHSSTPRNHASGVTVPHHQKITLLSSQLEEAQQLSLDLSNTLDSSSQVCFNAATNSTPTSSPFCSFCKITGHKIYSCSKFGATAVVDRLTFVKSNRMCFNCLNPNHLSSICSSTGVCSICRKKHHVLLHLSSESPKQNIALRSIERNSPNHRRGNHTNAVGTTSSRNPNQSETYNHNHSNSYSPNTSSSSHNNNNKVIARTQNAQPHDDSTNANALPNLALLNLNGGHVLLATANILIYSKNGSPIKARALLDPGSQNSFVCSNLVKKLNLDTYSQPLWISGICNKNQNINSMVDLTFYSTIETNLSFEATCAVVDQITRALPQIVINDNLIDIPQQLRSSLADPTFGVPAQIDILLGADIYYTLLTTGIYKLGKNLPTLVSTHLGWIISGTVPSQCLSTSPVSWPVSHSFHIAQVETPETNLLDNLVEKFWNQEELSSEIVVSDEDSKAENVFQSSLKTLANGRFQVDLPLIHPTAYKNLGDSFVMAKHRFMSLEKRLDKNPQLKAEYKKLLFEYIKLGHGQLVPLVLQTPQLDHKYFVPHLCVVKESSVSTKIRIVFDYSAKSSSNMSLNDISLKGPRVQPELLDILIRFRNFKYALTADISKMYRQIEINPTFHFLQNVLWRDSPLEPFSCIQLNTVSFGQTSAPFLACRVLKEIALRNPQFPRVQESILFQTYVDDILTGADDFTELEILYHNLKSVLSLSGFELHKFCSNSDELVVKHFPDSLVNKNLNLEENPSKVLGIVWNPINDMLQISTPSSFDCCLTKRYILSTVSQCFDPLGIVNPVIVQGKLLLQQLWSSKISWDEPISDPTIIKNWTKFVADISSLTQLHIPRYTLLDKTVRHVELHGFCDASSVAYGGCIYLRAIYSDRSVSSQLIISKSRVAPLNKPLTIPKLELCAMVLLSNLFDRVVNILNRQLNISSSTLWSDSQIALSWIRSSPTRWAVFVCNRVAQIQQLTQTVTWRHIKSQLNPADLLSRGQSLEFPSKFWFSGPSFLWKEPHDTACYDTFSGVSNPPEENKKSLIVISPPTNPYLCMISRCSSLTKANRAMAHVFKFIRIVKNPSIKSLPLTRQELDDSLLFLVQQVQQEAFPNLIKNLKSKRTPSDKRLLSLNLFIDERDVIRVGGRLHHADLTFQQKHPILLPPRNHFTSLLLTREHKRLGHSGPQNVLANIRLQFWPIDGLREIKRIISKCTMCHRFKAITAQQIMSDLPKTRVTPSRPFQNVGIDFAGPFQIKSSTLRKAPILKCYVSLFVCFATKAIHLELVSELSTDAFIATLKRFISRRGLPTRIYSDNATNFVGANNYLRDISQFLTKNYPHIHDYLLTNSIEWKFIPPRSPHWGGLWEAGVRSVKTHLIKLLSTMTLTFEQFSTVLSQVEAILNSRPLFPLSSDPNDLRPLTPGHFLIGAPLMSIPEKDVSQLNINRLKFWQQCTYVQQHFWRRWSTDYLNQLQNRPKWATSHPDLQIGDMVLVKDDDTPPLKWPLARVTDVILGKDGKVRSVQVRTPSGTYVRPIVKLVPLPKDESHFSQN